MQKKAYLTRGIIGLLLCGCLAASVGDIGAAFAEDGNLEHFQMTASYASTAFSDVKESDWFYDNVKAAYEYGLMEGHSATTFDPNGNVTIAQTITLASRLHSIFYTGSTHFETSHPWYQVYVDYASENEIVTTGFEDYDRAATRAQYATILSAALPDAALESINQIPDGMIPDVKTSDAYGKAVYKLYRAGILMGNDDKGTFFPDSNIRRSEVAAIVSRMADPDKRIRKSADGQTGNTPVGKKDKSDTSIPSAKPTLPPATEPPSTPKPSAGVEPPIYGPSFLLKQVDAPKGTKDVEVTVALKNNPGVASVGLTVSYDSALTLKSVVYNSELGGNYMLPPTMSNPVKLVWVSLADVTEDTVLATLRFDVSEDAAPGYHQIAAVYDADDVFNMAMDNVSFAVINGSINVTEE